MKLVPTSLQPIPPAGVSGHPTAWPAVGSAPLPGGASAAVAAPGADSPGTDSHGAGQAADLGRVLTTLAEIASETLDLPEVFGRVAAAIRPLIPFDEMGIVRLLDGEWAVKYAATVPCPDEEPACAAPCRLTHWSPRMRPRPGPIERIHDAPRQLDPAFPGDAEILAHGVHSTLWEPFGGARTFRGGVWLCAQAPAAFTDEHQQWLKPITALLGAAVEHWSLFDAERRRQERLDRVEALLGTLAESLDIAEIFSRLSEAVRPVLAHDFMVLTELDARARTIRISAAAGEAAVPVPTAAIPLTDAELGPRRDPEIVHDLPREVRPDTDRQRLLLSTGMRSWLRVPLLLSDDIQGSLSVFSREPNVYSRDDVEVAARLADRVALVLSHQKLAEEARQAGEARDRAERLAATVETLSRELESRQRGRVVGVSRSWREALVAVGRVAPSDTTVLITGESGTGKEVISGLIHQGSARAGRPFVAINCASLPDQLLESELFGHEKGAFTGATATKIGRIEQAAGGTLFLDEIGEMSPLVQAKMLRVLQEREFMRVGGTRLLKADVRVIAATNRDLAAAIARQEFREDLYYRLNVFQVHLAPLRERPEDILPLAEVFLAELGRTMGRPAAGVSRDAREWLLAYPWPGNVRELRNAIERAILLCDGGLITREHLPGLVTPRPAPPPVPAPTAGGGAAATNGTAPAAHNGAGPAAPGGLDLEAVEREFILKALAQTKWNKTKAARLLNLTRAQLYSRLERYGIQ